MGRPKKQVSNLDNVVHTNKESITATEEAIKQLKLENSDLKQRVNTLTDSLTKLQDAYVLMEQKYKRASKKLRSTEDGLE